MVPLTLGCLSVTDFRLDKKPRSWTTSPRKYSFCVKFYYCSKHLCRCVLLFPQDLFQAGCISEDEYHASKSPVIQRLAKQGALIDSEDFVMLLRAPPGRGPGAADYNNSTSTAPPNIVDDASAAEDAVTDKFGATANGDESSPHVNVVKKAPIKKMLEAMSILKNTTKPTWCVSRSFDFVTLV